MNVGTDMTVRTGMTLVEAAIALALTTMMCAGVYMAGLQSLRFAQGDRLSTEARAAGRQRLEEVMAVRCKTLAMGTSSCLKTTTNTSTCGHPIVIRPNVVWHASDGTITQSSAAAYAEIKVDVTYRSLLSKKDVTEDFSMVLSE